MTVKLEGYLHRKCGTGFRSWKRKWFFLSSDNKFCYLKRQSNNSPSVIESDLKLCLVKPLVLAEKKYCFELISPSKSFILQASTEDDYNSWLDSLKQGITSAWNEAADEERSLEKKKGLKNSQCAIKILEIPGNDKCADCEALSPEWACINWGVVICIECSGIHRSLGVHLSKVKAVKLDVWEAEVVNVQLLLGNRIVNKILEGDICSNIKKPNDTSARQEKEKWIKDKYVFRKFTKKSILQALSKDLASWSVKKKNPDDTKANFGIEKESFTYERKPISFRYANVCQDKIIMSELRKSPRQLNISTHERKPDESKSPNFELKKHQKSRSITSLGDSGTVLDIEEALFGTTSLKVHDVDPKSTEGCLRIDNADLPIPNMMLYRASRVSNLPVMLSALAFGADIDWQCPLVGEGKRSAIHQSVLSENILSTELLMLHDAKTTVLDSQNNTAFDLASKLAKNGQMSLLLKHRARREGD